jgi:hypothetical protein
MEDNMDIEKELKRMLNDINYRMESFSTSTEVRAQLLIAKANVLIALQKYE